MIDKSDPVNDLAVASISNAILYVNEPASISRPWPSNELIRHVEVEGRVAPLEL